MRRYYDAHRDALQSAFAQEGTLPERVHAVVDAYLDSRLGPAEHRSQNPEAGRRFKFWFNCDPDEAGSKTEYMQGIRTHIRRVQRRSDGQLRYSFLESRSHRTVFDSG